MIYVGVKSASLVLCGCRSLSCDLRGQLYVDERCREARIQVGRLNRQSVLLQWRKPGACFVSSEGRNKFFKAPSASECVHNATRITASCKLLSLLLQHGYSARVCRLTPSFGHTLAAASHEQWPHIGRGFGGGRGWYRAVYGPPKKCAGLPARPDGRAGLT